MIEFVTRLLTREGPALGKVNARDAGALAALHAACFGRGWSESEFAQLLLEPNVLAHQATMSRSLVGFIMSRRSGDEAEILSIAVNSRRRQRGIAGRLLDLHLRTLAGFGVNSVFLEVDKDNVPARRLYAGASFHEVGRRESYYARPQTGAGAALILRRDLA
jgi:[ribosomal protein S18]-alanine N-acetyltransferase